LEMLYATSPEEGQLRPFREGLRELGFVEGQNVAIEYRWAKNDLAQLPELAADLVRRLVAVIVTPGGSPATSAAKLRPQRSRSYFTSAQTPSKQDSSRASTGRAAISPASPS
jgi:hypothetical protein